MEAAQADHTVAIMALTAGKAAVDQSLTEMQEQLASL